MPQERGRKQEEEEQEEIQEPSIRQRVVFYAENKPDSLAIIDRFNIYYVTSRKHKNKSEALKHLLKIALDVEEQRQREKDPDFIKGDEADEV